MSRGFAKFTLVGCSLVAIACIISLLANPNGWGLVGTLAAMLIAAGLSVQALRKASQDSTKPRPGGHTS